MLACTETITLVRCTGDEYITEVIRGVSWYEKIQVTKETTGLSFSNYVQARIPSESLSAVSVLPEVGDHIFLGLLSAGETITSPSDLAKHQPRKVMSVGDNRRGKFQHLAVIAQ